MINLDANSTTKILPQVMESMLDVIGCAYNPMSIYQLGKKARLLVDNARDEVTNLVGANGADVIFTSSASEANNMAINGLDVDQVAVSAVEHLSILEPAKLLRHKIIAVDSNGIVQMNSLKALLVDDGLNAQYKILVSVMLVNNETGVIQPIKEIARIVHEHGHYIHCDAAQAVGKIPVDFYDLNIDMMTISAHKFGGPQGAGALIVKKGIDIKPFIHGGGQENMKRAGTHNVPAIVGFGVACAVTANIVDKDNLRDYLEEQIIAHDANAIIFGAAVARIPNTTMFASGIMDSNVQLIAFDLAGIAVSSGSACSSGKVASSYVLESMGVENPVANRAIRVSLHRDTTKSDIDRFITVWKGNQNDHATAV